MGELAARFVACHGPDWRPGAKALLIQLIDTLIPIKVEDMIRSGEVSAEEWRGPGRVQ